MASDGSGDNPVVVQVQSVTQLRDYEIKQEQINIQKVTMASHRWVCCCHEYRKDRRKRFIKRRVTVVNIHSKAPHPRSWPSIAESATMNPTEPLLALKGKREPSKVFKRHSRLRRCQLIAYKTDKQMKWMALTGLYKEETGFIHGVTQLYSQDYQLSQCIDSYAVGFCEYTFNGNPSMSTVICIATRTPGKQGKIHILELGPHITGNSALSNHTDDVNFSQASEFKRDFPVSLQISEDYGLIFILTKNGWLQLCDLETGFHISSMRVSQHVIFTTCLSADAKGILGVSRNGKVLSIKIKEGSLLNHLTHNCKKISIAQRLGQKFALTEMALLRPYTQYDTTV